MSGASGQSNRILKRLNDLESRVEKLEAMSSPRKTNESIKSKKGSEGLQGGIQLLVDNGFFAKQRTSSEVKAELDREAYFYSIQTVTKALTRDFTKRKQILTRVKNEEGTWVYAIRK